MKKLLAVLALAVQAYAVPSKPMTDLMIAAYNQDKETVESLLLDGANASEALEETYIHKLCSEHPPKTMGPESLVLAGATALMFAAQSGSLEITQALIDTGANVNASTQSNGVNVKGKDLFGGWTALDFAKKNNHQEVAGLLTKLGATSNRKVCIIHAVYTAVMTKVSRA